MCCSLQIDRRLRRHLRRTRLPAVCADHQRSEIDGIKIGQGEICQACKVGIASHRSRGTTADSMSPTILNSPAIKPKRSCSLEATGTAFATGAQSAASNPPSSLRFVTARENSRRARPGNGFHAGQKCQECHLDKKRPDRGRASWARAYARDLAGERPRLPSTRRNSAAFVT
jgi:hypothetical protein